MNNGEIKIRIQTLGLTANLNKIKYLRIGGDKSDLHLDEGKVGGCECYEWFRVRKSRDENDRFGINERIIQGRIVISRLNSISWNKI